MTVKIESGGPSAIRPPSHFSANSQRSTMMSSCASLDAVSESKRRSILILSLIATCVFLFVLCLCLLSALVLVGKNLSVQSSPPLFSPYISQMSSAAAATAAANSKKTGKSIDHFNRPSLFEEDKGTPDRAEEENASGNNKTTIFLPNSVYSGASDGMNVLKMGSKVIEKLSFRLPRHITPRHYELLLHPDLDQQTFAGRVGIDIIISEPTDYIVLHSKQLLITDTLLKRLLPDRSERVVAVKQTYAYEPHQYWVIETEDIESGEYRLSMNFSGSLANRIVGFYSSSYKDKGSNTTRKIATSKFEPTFARQAFPCFDEPQLKATYTISLVHPNTDNYHALSNMDVYETIVDSPSAGFNTTVFNPSVPMSTYLVVFIVSDFHHQMTPIRPNIGKEFELRVYATPFQMANVEFARNTAASIIQHYIDYFQIEYPLPKLDMAAIPDFVSGAMETWGLVTYRETSILYNKETSSTANKQRVAEVIAHELAHMWFGNLVTMKWWNELWLNEGFASYIEYKGVDHAYPAWGIMEQFTIDNLHGVLSLDATIGSHPIVVKVESPNQITEIFDTITYSKGASVIRMLEDFVGVDVFKQGVTAYLNELKYSNGVSDDLMKELDKLFNEPDVTVARVMDTFTKQKGFPVITVERFGNQYRCSQSRFLADPDAKETEISEFNYKWFVPLTYIASGEPSKVLRKWFPNNVTNVNIDVEAGTTWIKLNSKQVGYYRVNYPEDMWRMFSEALVNDVNTFAIGDRTGLLNDAFALADASQLRYDLALGLTKFLVEETEYVPWVTVASKMKGVRNLIYDYESYNDIITYVRNLVQKAYETVGWEVVGEDHMKNRLRTTILDLACSFGHEQCLSEALSKFRSWLDSNSTIHPDIRTVVYYYGMQRSANVADWEKVKERFRNEIDANEKTKLMSALAGFPDAGVLRRFLEESWDPTLVREQDHLSCIQNVASNKHGEQVAWDHVRMNWDRLVERYTLSERNLGRMIPSVTGRFSSSVRLNELEDFFKRYPEAGAGATARVQALENISNNIKWLERNQQNVADWLKNEVAQHR
ncbi:aminopeptidase A isoform X1 [Toxorhynchites rutilus septentrionalis]|uniref:aminopeptidase A isoform X1 n=1 Tax=Toxorhynchites rutilus septentrionalis TaxID=329112 RepID=UPI0024799576|nr:aminopeptidase A isoform X1 [Toxorhynchites rutilus septentrionalis]XP_055614925.1 aminopeptidase A isoform X1 [Toxorhynchites rutilus septentrionalis]XP_055614926.1 aminopeptidase A isoform X1 [Toxorhynchites rutilus septentrionalis]XP_055614927.1 aminopeptidase A isoform X1 [Toxorhynchites rutilus septentrionalis]